jgi:hypothetical protein
MFYALLVFMKIRCRLADGKKNPIVTAGCAAIDLRLGLAWTWKFNLYFTCRKLIIKLPVFDAPPVQYILEAESNKQPCQSKTLI